MVKHNQHITKIEFQAEKKIQANREKLYAIYCVGQRTKHITPKD